MVLIRYSKHGRGNSENTKWFSCFSKSLMNIEEKNKVWHFESHKDSWIQLKKRVNETKRMNELLWIYKEIIEILGNMKNRLYNNAVCTSPNPLLLTSSSNNSAYTDKNTKAFLTGNKMIILQLFRTKYKHSQPVSSLLITIIRRY